ncbi:MAG TPA: tRNA (adenosine(37)-N6)-dimethylallyltransferase MiaA [Candidatus Moranbacteria bacterium]|nr:tRNA (adenosine(37)-N6)-dimethylallyltransferase MiaA [Candidatus Moranbacteria bacterium]
MKVKSKIIIILGPTSSGKSDIAIKLAKKFNGEIISADSRQVYRGMDIGTGKIEADHPAEIPQRFANSKSYAGPSKNKSYLSGKIPHYLIDNASPRTNYNAAKFKKDAEKIIANISKRRKLPIICGGTGFWIKSVVDDISYPEVKPDWKLRKKLNSYPTEKLFKMLQKLDPERAGNIDVKNKVRLIRAIEICKTLGFVPSLSSSPSGRGCPVFGTSEGENYDFLQLGIFLPKEKLHENIEKRLRKRFDQGMIEEVKNLHYKNKLSWKKIESFGLGYFWIPKYLRKEIATKEELFQKIFQAEKDYAKRQMTWFQKDKRIKWVPDYKNIEKETLGFIKN